MVSLGWQERVTQGWLAATLPWWAPLWILGSVVRGGRRLLRVGVVALLVVGSAQAQGWEWGWSAPSPVVARYPLTTHGAGETLIPQTADSVAHVVFRDGALVDLKGNVWTKTGNPTVAGVSPFTPDRQGGSGFTSGAYYSAPTAGVLDVSNNVAFTVEAVAVAGASRSTTEAVLSNKLGGGSNLGVDMFVTAAGALGCRVADGTSSVSRSTSTGVVTGGAPHHFACTVSWSAGTASVIAYVNGVATAAATGALGSVTSSNPVRLGYENYPNGQWTGVIHEARITRGTALSAAEIQRSFRTSFGHLGTRGEVVTVVGDAGRTYTANGQTWSVPANVARITADGIERSTETISVATPALATWRASTVDGAPSAGSVTPSNTYALPAGKTRNLVLCQRASACRWRAP